MKRLFLLLAGILVGGVCLSQAQAAPKDAAGTRAQPAAVRMQPKKVRSTKEVQGRIAGIGKRFIAVTYYLDATNADEAEIHLTVDPAGVKLDHVRSWDELKQFDMVRVQYEEETVTDEAGSRTTNKAKTVSFLKKGAAPVPRQSTPEGQGMDVLVSDGGA